MKMYVYLGDDLRPQRWSTSRQSESDQELDTDLSMEEIYVKDSQVIALPPMPDYPVVFNPDTEAWVLDDAGCVEAAIRKRNRLLYECDWTQVADAPVDQAAWAAYRQELRDVTSQETFPSEVTWPVAP
jgi:hypothetical protein